jgi:Flp pilus assembly protein TadD
MRRRFPLVLISAALLSLLGTPSHSPASAQSGHSVEPPSDAPHAAQGVQNLDKLFEALKVAPDDDSAKYIEKRIWASWLATKSDTTALLMSRVKTALDGHDINLALRLLTAVVDLQPDYIEAWNRRATIYFTQKEYSRAMADLREVLAREPRHFGALSGLGIILEEIGDDRGALEAFRRALAVHPHLEKIPDMVRKLSEKVEGRDI